ncbi:MAG: rhodanese-related sulfurtransferase [Rhizobiaceae bacterium]|nr:rhodanese-related sulfurtransferase [Rhizobiaceae bacterium]
MTWTVAALYRFVALDDLAALQAEARGACEAAGGCGSLLIAPEGVNGTIAAPGDAMAGLVDVLDRLFGVRQGELKFSTAAEKPFARLKVRLKREIITMRAPEADPTKRAGTYVEPGDWNALLDDPDIVLVDTRNAYETMVGTFEGAIDPNIQTFTDFKDFVAAELDPARHRKIAMYCTGGIRCEKASAFMLAKGFEEVFHLKGGILRYLEEVPAEESRWNGDCYVFDARVAVGHGLAETKWDRCFGCGAPLTLDGTSHADYEKGVSCHHCKNGLSQERAAAFRMRQSQIDAGRIGTSD